MQSKEPPVGSYTPLPQSESSSSRLVIIAMVIVLVVLCGVAAYLYMYNKGLAGSGVQSNTAQTNSATISPTVAASTPDAVLRDIKAIDVGSPESALSPVVKDVQGL